MPCTWMIGDGSAIPVVSMTIRSKTSDAESPCEADAGRPVDLKPHRLRWSSLCMHMPHLRKVQQLVQNSLQFRAWRLA
eukprot:6179604-Pleurochrysis_carterae.AAC.1